LQTLAVLFYTCDFDLTRVGRSIKPEIMSTLDDIMNEMGVKPQGQDSSEDDKRTYTMDDLDDLMAEVESQETRRRAPLTKEIKGQTEVRKTTTRKSATGALDDNDLDSVLDIIINSANRKITEKKNEIGWGVINAVCLINFRDNIFFFQI
jgi:hypothetical protein